MKFENKPANDPEIEKKLPRLPERHRESIMSIRAKKILHVFLQQSGKIHELADKLARAGAHQRLKELFHTLFEQIKNRKKLIFSRITKEIPFLINLFKAYGGKRELNIVTLLEKIDSGKLNHFLLLYVKLKSYEFRRKKNKEDVPFVAVGILKLETKIQEK